MYNVHHLCVQGIYTYKADVARAAIILWSYSKVLSLWQACHGKSTNISAIFSQVCQRAKVPFILIVSTWITHPTIPVIRNMKLTVMMQQNVEKWILEKNLVCLLWWVHEITQVMVKNCNFGRPEIRDLLISVDLLLTMDGLWLLEPTRELQDTF